MPDLVATTRDGVHLALHRFAATGPRRAVALMTHAMMANASYLRRFARFAAERGVESWLLDFRGHGGSVPPRAGHGPGWCFDDHVRGDLPAALAAVAASAQLPPGELVYLGHSLGGLAGLAAFGTNEAPAPRRLVLVAVNVWTRPRGRRRLVSAAFIAAARLLGRVPARTLRIGTDDEPSEYAQQFAQWSRHGFCARDGSDYRAVLPRVTAPTLALVGEGDWMCRSEDTRELVALVGGKLRLRGVGRAHGDALDPDHFQLLTDERLRNVWQETVDFMIG